MTKFFDRACARNCGVCAVYIAFPTAQQHGTMQAMKSTKRAVSFRHLRMRADAGPVFVGGSGAEGSGGVRGRGKLDQVGIWSYG